MIGPRLVLEGVVESVVKSRTNGPLLAAAAELWIPEDAVVLDVTYGGGMFWTVWRPEHLICHDLYLGDGVDFRALPEPDRSVDVVVFDPPYINQGGRDTSTEPEFLARFGLMNAPATVPELQALVTAGMTEATRVLRLGGRLMVKCMDYVSGGRFIKGNYHVVSTALDLGLEQVDEFIHHSGLGPQPFNRVQVHSRRSHTFLCVFTKSTRP